MWHIAGKYVLLWSSVCEKLKTHLWEAHDAPLRTRSIMSVYGWPVNPQVSIYSSNSNFENNYLASLTGWPAQHQSQVSKTAAGLYWQALALKGRPLRQVYRAASASGCHLSLKSSKEGRRPDNGDVSHSGSPHHSSVRSSRCRCSSRVPPLSHAISWALWIAFLPVNN